MNWYYSIEGFAKGPVDDEVLENLVRAGQLMKNSLIWHPELDRWKPLDELKPGLADQVRREREAILATKKGTPVRIMQVLKPNAPSADSAPLVEPSQKNSLLSRLFAKEKK